MSSPPLEIPFNPALSLVSEECRKATANGYLEPYYEMKRAALSLARQLLEARGGLRKVKSHVLLATSPVAKDSDDMLVSATRVYEAIAYVDALLTGEPQ